MPSTASLPNLPAGVVAFGDQVGGGSRSCSRTYFLGSGDEWAREELVAAQEKLNGCGVPNPLTLRRVCSFVSEHSGVVDLSQSYSRPW